MKKSILLLILFLASAMLLTGGCRSRGYYQDQAVNEARAFLLEELPSMPLMDREYIKFNRPFMLVSPISGSSSVGQAQICICWMTPDNPDTYMVFGVSSMRMQDWSPVRIIRKRFESSDANFLQIAAKASYEILQSNFDLLSVAAVNHLRFTQPGVWKTSFPLNSDPGCKLTTEELAAAETMKRYVLAWEIEENGNKFYAVYGGTAENDQLAKFKYYFKGIYPEAVFRANLTDPEPVIAPVGGVTER